RPSTACAAPWRRSPCGTDPATSRTDRFDPIVRRMAGCRAPGDAPRHCSPSGTRLAPLTSRQPGIFLRAGRRPGWRGPLRRAGRRGRHGQNHDRGRQPGSPDDPPGSAQRGARRGHRAERGGGRGPGAIVPAGPGDPGPPAPVHGRDRGRPLDQAAAGAEARRDPGPDRPGTGRGPGGGPGVRLLRLVHGQARVARRDPGQGERAVGGPESRMILGQPTPPRPVGMLTTQGVRARRRRDRGYPYAIGERIAGDLLVIGHLAAGRLGHLYQVWSTGEWTPLTCKILAPELRDNARAVAALRREARILRRLRHPSLIRGFGEGVHDGLPYVLLEYVEGPSLFDLLEARPQRRFGVADAVRIAIHAAAGLHHLHRNGWLHLDLKPAN